MCCGQSQKNFPLLTTRPIPHPKDSGEVGRIPPLTWYSRSFGLAGAGTTKRALPSASVTAVRVNPFCHPSSTWNSSTTPAMGCPSAKLYTRAESTPSSPTSKARQGGPTSSSLWQRGGSSGRKTSALDTTSKRPKRCSCSLVAPAAKACASSSSARASAIRPAPAACRARTARSVIAPCNAASGNHPSSAALARLSGKYSQ